MIGTHRNRELQEADSGAPEEPMNEPMTADSVISCTIGFPACRDDGSWCDGLSYDCTSEEGYCDCDAGRNFCAGGINSCSGDTGESEPVLDMGNIEVDGPCLICKDGIAVNEWFSSAVDDDTCEILGENYKAIAAEGSELCESVKGSYQQMCCPTPPEKPCCPDGVDTSIFDFLTDMMTSGDTDNGTDGAVSWTGEPNSMCDEKIIAQFESDSDECQIVEQMCCPTAPENPCVCPNGVTATTISDALLNSMANDEMDGEMSFSVDEMCSMIPRLQQIEADSDECDEGEWQGLELLCCPTTPKDPCSLCPNTGITVDDKDFMCEQGLEFIKMLEADSQMCKEMEFEQFICCPTLAKTPCSLCQDNESFNADLMLDNCMGTTCGEVSLATEEGSEACEYVKDSSDYWDCCGNGQNNDPNEESTGDENDLGASSLNPELSNTVTEEEPAAEEDPEVGDQPEAGPQPEAGKESEAGEEQPEAGKDSDVGSDPGVGDQSEAGKESTVGAEAEVVDGPNVGTGILAEDAQVSEPDDTQSASVGSKYSGNIAFFCLIGSLLSLVLA